jgi:hypothetical protein
MRRARQRRPDDGKHLPKDAAAWRKLARLAAWAARHPDRTTGDLTTACHKAVRAVMPPGHQHRGSVFLQLLLKAQVFAASNAGVRAGLARDLLGLADACDVILGTGRSAAYAEAERPDPADAWRRRADLD